jgi:membrane dipeptidase
MLLFDAHLDLAFNAVDWNRDLELTIAEIRAAEASMTELGRGTGTVSLPEMRRGELGICLATMFARLRQTAPSPYGSATPEACYAVGSGHQAYYRAMERRGLMRSIKSREDLSRHLADWTARPDRAPLGYLLSMECADMVLDPDHIFEWYESGLRAIGLTHYGVNRYGGGTNADVGLKPEAKPLLRNIEQLKLPLDLTHLSDRAFDDAIEGFGGRVMASHQNSRKFANWQRQFTDAQIQSVIERDGVLGMALDVIMMQEGYVRGKTKPEVTLERVVDNVDHICQLAGHARNVGIGSDLDGGYGTEQTPADLDTIADLQKLPDLLARRGYSTEDIQGVMHGNWIRFFGETLPDA